MAILDFASLYPSIYRAYNLCYTTLIHEQEDVARAGIDPEDIITTPTGARFVNPSIRPGILPSILAALISARATTRAELAATTAPARRAVLDSRQKALKVTANALYGFTGAQASQLQCVPLADSCLAYGAESCRRAKEVLEHAAANGRLGPSGSEARVIYGHTDSLFLHLPQAVDIRSAMQTAKTAAHIGSSAFPAPMELKFERVCAPFMLLHVNRYAGRAFEKESDAAGELIVKGLRSMWRQTAPILRTTLHGCLVRILMQNDSQGAFVFVQKEIYRLLSGGVRMDELTMTGGLWRVTGEQVQERAAGNSGGGGTGSHQRSTTTTTAGNEPEDIRGPHVALAVRLKQRDGGRSFVLGERLPYVLTGGHKLQDDASEDPLYAAKHGIAADVELYWKKKMMPPLKEVFSTCLSQSQLQSLLYGPHTLVKVDKMKYAPPPSTTTTASPATVTPLKAMAKKYTPSPSSSKKQQQQSGLLSFFKAKAHCLGCKRVLSEFNGDAEAAPGLCAACAGEEGRWQQVYCGLRVEANEEELRSANAHAQCRQCDSGVLGQRVVCENGECRVTFARLESDRGLRDVGIKLNRMDISF